MAVFQIHKTTALPPQREPHSIYLVAPAANPNALEVYATAADGVTVRGTPTNATIQAMIDAAIAAGSGGASIANTIADRDALTPQNAQQVLVIDASADPTVETGGATYIWRESTTEWIKISETESLDISLTWGGIAGRPTSTPAQIDDAVSKAHAHANKTQLDLIGQDTDGNFTYNGELPVIEWNTVGW